LPGFPCANEALIRNRSKPKSFRNACNLAQLRSGKRAAAIMSLIQSARMNGHDPYAYLKDVLTRLATQRKRAVITPFLRDFRLCGDYASVAGHDAAQAL
jgi:hypothetical protein